ncbi:Hypothetical protein CINCED_3A006838 [Cinara cedri]|uniref:Uncharacterized protein n=1 Tax=Cinara cedri TaxID=506608 RepID=A0A5E4M4E4_9HEMI|nr:Hypothetical protein CINCED_3A006838 [Cinara cedri]
MFNDHDKCLFGDGDLNNRNRLSFNLTYSSTALSNNDELQIPIHNTESHTLPCESFMYFEGSITQPAGSTEDANFIHNGSTFLFSEIKYELNRIQIQKIVNSRISTTLKVYCSASLDINAVKFPDYNAIDIPKLKDVKINISKIVWKMPMVQVGDKEKIKLI